MKTVLLTGFLAIGVVAGSVPAVASDTSARHYGRQDTMRTQDVQSGRVLLVREIQIDNRSRANTGTAIGGAVGIAAAQAVKSSDGRKVARIVGGTSGALAGGAIHNAVTSRRGIEVVVETTDRRGRTQVVSIVQDNDQAIRAGDQVLLIGRGAQQRVVALEQAASPPPLSSWERRTGDGFSDGTGTHAVANAPTAEFNWSYSDSSVSVPTRAVGGYSRHSADEPLTSIGLVSMGIAHPDADGVYRFGGYSHSDAQPLTALGLNAR